MTPFLWLSLVLLATLIAPALAQKRVVCYFTNWAVYRPGDGKFTIENINPKLCTHAMYAFIGLNTDATIQISDPYFDVTQGGFVKFNNMRKINTNLKTLISINGLENGPAKFSTVCKSTTLRAKFVTNLFNFVRQYNFSGVDVDWEYPAQNGGIAADKANFVLLLKELKAKFSPAGLLVTAAVNAAPWAATLSYDIPKIALYLDFINLMTYDVAGPWLSTTGFNAPLPDAKSNVNYWISKGANKTKLLLGVPFYGRTFNLTNAAVNGVGAPTTGAGMNGGVLMYSEMCTMLQSQTGWNTVWNDTNQVPYYYKGNQWITHETIRSIQAKGSYAKSFGLGGVMVWAVDMDDFKNLCGGGNFTLMNTLRTSYGV